MSTLKIISNKSVFKARLFDIVEEKIELKSGIKIHHNIFKKSTVSIFPLTDLYELYLIKQYRSIYNKTILEAVAGYVDDNENPLQTAKRELKEETGLEARDWQELAKVDMAASVIKANSHIYLAKELKEGIANPEEDEKIELIKMPLEEAVKRVLSGEISISISMIGILMLDRLRRENKI